MYMHLCVSNMCMSKDQKMRLITVVTIAAKIDKGVKIIYEHNHIII
jgi:hypothetical protein